MAASIGHAEVDVARLAEVAVSAEMTDVAQIAALARVEDLVGVAAEYLAGRFEKQPWVRNQPGNRDPRVVDAVLAAHEVPGGERPIGPRQDMRVKRVDLAERRALLAHLHQQPARERGERDEAFFDADAGLAEREEEVGARVGIDDGLERCLGFRKRHRRLRPHGVAPRRAKEIADDGHVGVEDLRRRRNVAVNRQRSAGAAGALCTRRHLRRCGGGSGHRRRWGRRCPSTFKCGKPCFESREALLELAFHAVDLLAKRLRRCILLGRLLRRGVRLCQ